MAAKVAVTSLKHCFTMLVQKMLTDSKHCPLVDVNDPYKHTAQSIISARKRFYLQQWAHKAKVCASYPMSQPLITTSIK